MLKKLLIFIRLYNPKSAIRDPQLKNPQSENPQSAIRNPQLTTAFVLLPAFALLGWISWNMAIKSDDAYITFRVARHLADGQGMVYNPGERWQVSSTPLYTLLLAGTRAVTGAEIDTASRVWEFVFLVIDALLLGWILVDLGYAEWAWLAPLLFLTEPTIVSFSKGMEMALFAAFSLATLIALRRRRPLLTAAFLAGTVLTRLDGLILGVLVAGVSLGREWHGLSAWFGREWYRLVTCTTPGRWLKVTAAQFAVFAALTLPWFAIAWVYFGHPLPVTISHKLGQVHAMSIVTFGPEFFKGLLWSRFVIAAPGLERGIPIPNFAVVPFAIGAVILLLRRGPRFRGTGASRPSYWLVEWWALALAVYAAAGMPYYPWYPYPLYTAGAAIVAVGIVAMITRPMRLATGRARWIVGVAACLVIVARGVQLVEPWPYLTLLSIAPENSQLRNGKALVAIARDLDRRAPPDAVVAAFEVGYLGYFSERRILDLTGLTSPLTSAERTSHSLRIVMNRQADYLVIEKDVYDQYAAPIRQEFEAAYRIEKTFFDPFMNEKMLVFARANAARI
jgi:hypothetical protein